MKSVAVSYTEELLKEQKYLANWLPNNPIKLGDIGEFKDNCFIRLGNIADHNIPFEKEEGAVTANINYNSSSSVTINTKLTGTLLPDTALTKADAGVIIEFSKERAIVIKTKDTRIDTIKNKIALEQSLLKLYKQNVLKRRRAVITEVVYAAAATILVSSGKNARIELKANAALDTAAIDIADAGLQFSVPFKKEIAEEFIAEKGLVIFYRAMAVKDSLFTEPGVVSNSGYKSIEEAGNGDTLFAEIDFDFKPVK